MGHNRTGGASKIDLRTRRNLIREAAKRPKATIKSQICVFPQAYMCTRSYYANGIVHILAYISYANVDYYSGYNLVMLCFMSFKLYMAIISHSYSTTYRKIVMLYFEVEFIWMSKVYLGYQRVYVAYVCQFALATTCEGPTSPCDRGTPVIIIIRVRAPMM